MNLIGSKSEEKAYLAENKINCHATSVYTISIQSFLFLHDVHRHKFRMGMISMMLQDFVLLPLRSQSLSRFRFKFRIELNVRTATSHSVNV